MSHISHKVIVPYTQEQMFDLVNDVASYPDFLPGCKSSKIISESDSVLTARVDLEKGPVSLYWISENTNIRPNQIKMRYIEGTFSSMEGEWSFSSKSQSGCEISFSIQYELSSNILSLAISPIINAMIITIVNCFRARAKEVYGDV